MDDVIEALTALGNAYRDYWGDLDGRALKAELDELAGALQGAPFDIDSWWDNSGICRECGYWRWTSCICGY